MRKYLLIIIALFSIGWSSSGGWDVGSLFTRTVRYQTERLTATDTITAGESGKMFSIYCPSGNCDFTLPTAQKGMLFTFISELKTAFDIIPATTDTIRYYTATPLAVGDKLVAGTATYSTITVFSTQDNYWNVKDVNGTFTDGN